MLPFLKAAIQESLFNSQWSAIELARAFHQLKFRSELIGQTRGTISDNVQPTASCRSALRRSFKREGRHDHMAVASHRVAHGLHVPATFFWLHEKMIYGSVVPHIIAVTWEIGRGNVGLDPGHRTSTSAEALPRKFKCSSNNIKHGYVLIALCEKFIHEAGSPPAHINDLSFLANSCAMDQF
jgi:hypothetical protein